MWAWALWLLPLLCRPTRAALPTKPENISCVYYYKRNFTCTWSPERAANHTWYQVTRNLTLGKVIDSCNSTSEGPASCSFFHMVTYPETYTIRVQARNVDGTAESDVTVWNLNETIKVEPPMNLSVQPVPGIKRMLHVQWVRPSLAPISVDLNYTLRFRANESDLWTEVSFEEVDGGQAYNLTGLQASTRYIVALRCAAPESKFWSGWSQEAMGTTEEEVPFGLDVWRVLGPVQADGRRLVDLRWKKARGTPPLERTLGYLVQYFPENGAHLARTSDTTDQHLGLRLGRKAYRVSVASYNSLGQGPAATLRVPAVAEKPVPCIEAMQTHLAGDQLVVTWQSSAPDVDMWVVEWLPDQESAALCWEPVSGAQNWTVQRAGLTFWCYNVSVYPVLRDRVGEPSSAQVYFEQDAPSAGPVTKVENIGVKTVTVTWKEVPKSQRNGFIRNYTIFCQAENGQGFSRTVEPGTLRYGLGSLARGTPYTLQVMASTRAGGTNGTRVNFRTLSISVLEICLITTLVGGGLLILTVLTVVYGFRRPNKLKRLCWPQVPNPAQSSLATWRWDGLQVSPCSWVGGGGGGGRPCGAQPGPGRSCRPSQRGAWGGGGTSPLVSGGRRGAGRRRGLGAPSLWAFGSVVHSPHEPPGAPLFQTKLPQKPCDDSVTADDRALKPRPAPSDLIDKLVVNFGSFLEEVSSEESGKGRENPLGGEDNEYVTCPARPPCPPGRGPGEPPTAAEAAPAKPQPGGSGRQAGAGPGASEPLLPPAQGAGPARVPGEGAPNPYLKNSVTTREFLLSETLPDHGRRET
ncbi:interleukin-31 receptor subunit alpha [Phyllostomus discolor]|uniref:Interleukin-31 receptor subunit alpha n=1 Tax=Phyllostomus discolor TaxID=89673 RepID=A0A7E6D9C1_9CHIR|nr:interleukin-31 receptor subunit alpha [Phyllostomus discolor]